MEKRFGPCPAAYDDDYMFHMTIAIGGAEFVKYEKTYEDMCKLDFKRAFIFDKLGLLYYDDDSMKPGTYFCYKIVELYKE